MSNLPPPPSELEWIELSQDIRKSNILYEDGTTKFARKFKENPLVPIGCGFTVCVLSYGIYNFARGRTKMSQKMMRLRVVAQGATVVALIGGIIASYSK